MDGPANPAPRRVPPAERATRRGGAGEFGAGSHSHASRTLRYRLFVPPTAKAAAPLLVMLHGCSQDPEDFAAGTGMNALALERGWFVLYPAQSSDANPGACWNWFDHDHQRRGHGEPALIASMAVAVMRAHAIDPTRVFIAGLSAGGAMSALVTAAYPELFAGVGVHSGLAPGAARGLGGALAAMRGQAPPIEPGALLQRLHRPVIVFHGDRDHTVHSRNGEHVIAAALGADKRRAGPRISQGVSAQGRLFTRSIHAAGAGAVAAEHWLLHGAGHAWSGGGAGSFTDARGPDASREMLRFFVEQSRARLH